MTAEIVVGGIPLCETYQCFLTSYNDDPPEQKVSHVEIPGSDGIIDLSEWMAGRPLFETRSIDFTLYPIECDGWEDIEQLLTALRNYLHGRTYDFTLSWDKPYTYRGRFEVVSQKLYTKTVGVKIKVTCDPYKSKGVYEYVLNGELGKTYIVNGPAKVVTPVITCTTSTIININGQSFALDAGSWVNEDAKLHNGKNIVVVNTTPNYGTAIWRDYKGDTWSKYESLRFGYMARAGIGRLKGIKWSAYTGRTWDSIHGMWHDNAYVGDNESHDGNDITLAFEWKDI